MRAPLSVEARPRSRRAERQPHGHPALARAQEKNARTHSRTHTRTQARTHTLSEQRFPPYFGEYESVYRMGKGASRWMAGWLTGWREQRTNLYPRLFRVRGSARESVLAVRTRFAKCFCTHTHTHTAVATLIRLFVCFRKTTRSANSTHKHLRLRHDWSHTLAHTHTRRQTHIRACTHSHTRDMR